MAPQRHPSIPTTPRNRHGAHAATDLWLQVVALLPSPRPRRSNGIVITVPQIRLTRERNEDSMDDGSHNRVRLFCVRGLRDGLTASAAWG
jgi:hypothetical protein